MIKEITVYTRTTCAPCRMLKQWLKNKELNYNEVNVDDNPVEGQKAYELSGFSIVPLTVITKKDDSQQVIAGLNFSALAALI